MWKEKACFRFEIDNFSGKEAAVMSNVFVSGGYEWYISLLPKGEDGLYVDYSSLYLYATNSKPVGSGWKRIASFYFVLLNQSHKALYRSAVEEHIQFQADSLSWGFAETLPLRKFQKQGLLENDKLIAEVYIHMVDSFDGELRHVSEKKETVDINGFQLLASQATLARKIFAEHPDLAYDFTPRNQVVRTEYMNVLLSLVETLDNPSLNHSETELSNVRIELSELAEAGFKLDWLYSKLDEVSLKREKAGADSQVQGLDEPCKDDHVMKLLTLLNNLKAKLEKSDYADGSRFKEMEGRISDLEMVVSDLKLKLEEASSFSDDDDTTSSYDDDFVEILY
ncbi:hypothetical protein CARUB_v10024897mg [Capsella rubella]|uniref:MATH domain-containing protein n=1 Tax=Capsella rubella TaxID=81985 RepID=R0HX60_9BRAS|nr:hypothetical protein CARUB_v10024897mg [Capsella rubella]